MSVESIIHKSIETQEAFRLEASHLVNLINAISAVYLFTFFDNLVKSAKTSQQSFDPLISDAQAKLDIFNHTSEFRNQNIIRRALEIEI